ncbi:nuclease [Guyparkeria sp. SCN-R1]|uniref:nuclease-related domain-containing protein n=1 Tax=Guyparkeria sp. SCN-R1 TaxID=2341113 RepID=UPI000F654175|nr:NERD domain-containing protein [Guyparkeria sp. SCN-R1]RRQ23477.1 nuclease [Guyparkeria sp. SCN-R1]
MDYLSALGNALSTIWWLIPLIIIAGILKTPWFKGIVGEFWVKVVALFRLPSGTYHALHNVTVRTPDGTTQIDHVFVSLFGLFVVETKHMRGWIFGDERQPKWTQKIYRKTVSFQNPLRQNYKHVKALEALLDLPADTIHSVVVFTGDCRFKTPMPANVTRIGGYVRYIRSFETPVLNAAQVRETIAAIESGRLVPTRATHRQRVAHLKARSDPNAMRHCPQCGSEMVLRTAKRGANVGKRFWGCSTFPICRVRQDVD